MELYRQDSLRTTFLVCEVADFCYPDNALQQGMNFKGDFVILAKSDGSGMQVSTFSFRSHASSSCWKSPLMVGGRR